MRKQGQFITGGAAACRKTEAEDFARRCRSALEVARQVGDADWKIEGLEEALHDAEEAIADWRRLGV